MRCGFHVCVLAGDVEENLEEAVLFHGCFVDESFPLFESADEAFEELEIVGVGCLDGVAEENHEGDKRGVHH